MRRFPSRLFAVALVVTLTLGGSAPAGAAERSSWPSVAELLDWLVGWRGAPRPANAAAEGRVPPLDLREAAALEAGVGQDPYGRTPPPPSPLVLEGTDFE